MLDTYDSHLASAKVWIISFFDLEATNFLHSFGDFVLLDFRIAHAPQFIQPGKDCPFEVRDSPSKFFAFEIVVN